MNLQEEYESKFEVYKKFEEDLRGDISQIVTYERLSIQILTSRLKDPTSFKHKVQSDLKYKTLSHVTDIVGIRIVTTYLEEIPYIESKIREAFIIDEENTNTNKKNESEFGYASFHIVVSDSKINSFKTYNPNYKGLKAEIQIRSILQHSWAEVSHKYEYKAKQKPESEQRRKLFRIAALLELADQEFSTCRKEIIENQKSLVPRDITKYTDQPIDINSLHAFVVESDTCNALDQKIANLTNSVIHYNEYEISEMNFSQITELNIKTLKELDSKLKELSKEIIIKFQEQNEIWIHFRKAFPEAHGNSSVPRGICISYLYVYLKEKLS